MLPKLELAGNEAEPVPKAETLDDCTNAEVMALGPTLAEYCFSIDIPSRQGRKLDAGQSVDRPGHICAFQKKSRILR